MNNKSALAITFLIFSFALSAFADDAPTEVVVTGQQIAQYSTSAQQQTPIEMPKSSGDSQYSSEGYIKAMAEKAAAEEKGRRLQACYQQLASLDKSKYACSEDGELIDVVEVTGVNNNAPSLVNVAAYNELDNTRPVAPVIPKPESCNANAIALKLASCQAAAETNFQSRADNCIALGAGVAAGGAVVGAGVTLYLFLKDPSAALTTSKREVVLKGGAAGATMGLVLADFVKGSCESHYGATKGVDLAQCALDEKTKIQECAKYD